MSGLPARILIANRAEIASRIIASVHAMGLEAVAIYTDADASMPYVEEADAAVHIGSAPPKASYLDFATVIAAAKSSNADAIHPGYGFLSENPDFAREVQRQGLLWIGPSAESIRELGDKVRARAMLSAAGVPVADGSEGVSDADHALREARRIGYPVMVKASAGGGGIGMSIVHDEAEMTAAFNSAVSGAARSFGDPTVFLERYIPNAQHVEIQILGLADGSVIALGERDCSVQRRHQKVAEETPSPAVRPELRRAMMAAAVLVGETVNYRNAGTVECLVDAERQEFVFLEMNTRLQVEHRITELTTGIDLVAAQINIAAGLEPGFDIDQVTSTGHALEMRIYAEDPRRFFPSPGKILRWDEPSGEGVLVDSGYQAGNTVTPFYDPLLAKLCVWGADRIQALDRARAAVESFRIEGIQTNLPLFEELLADGRFVEGKYDTGLISEMRSSSKVESWGP